jgi:hypothetical protein
MMRSFLAGIGVLFVLAASNAHARPIGELHRVAADSTASLRDAEQQPEVRVTIWYPAAADAIEHDIVIGPPESHYSRWGRSRQTQLSQAVMADDRLSSCRTVMAARPE